MGMRGASAVVFLALVFGLVTGPASATLQDGLPRPTGYPVTPSASYGPTPAVTYNGLEITCEWYGFSHVLYPLQGAQCNAGMRRVLSNATLVPPSSLKPYIYYFSTFYVFDTTTNTSYCLYGCFDLSSTSTAPPPSSLFAPPPSSLTAPPPVIRSPPPPVVLAPPPVEESSPPPPVVLSSPPPPVSLRNPPPATLFSPPPPSTTTSPPGGAGTSPPPPGVDGTRIINLNAAPGFLQPAGVLSVLLSGALLFLAAF